MWNGRKGRWAYMENSSNLMAIGSLILPGNDTYSCSSNTTFKSLRKLNLFK
jgi:hypothetical protein